MDDGINSEDRPVVSVVIPCLNEAETLAGCIEAAWDGISAAGIPGEVVVGDNGSTDGSIAIAERCGAWVAHCPRRGYGNALRTGFAAARGEWILMGDADQSYDFRELPRFNAKIREGYDMVMGSRLRGSIEPGAMPWLHRYVGNPVLSGILRLLFRSRVSDAHCGMRAFRRDALPKMDLRTSGMELASEMVIKATTAGLRMAEIPITLHKDARNRPPHLRSFRDGWRHLRYMLMMAPNWLFLAPGCAVTMLGALLMLALLPGPRYFSGVRLDIHTMFLGMALILLGVYLVLTGLFVKVFTHTDRLAIPSSGFTRLLSRMKLEHGLVGALVLMVIGFAGDMRFFLVWRESGFGDLDVHAGMRMAIVYTTVLVVGFEILFASFFLSMLGIDRDTYEGDSWRRARDGRRSD
jgi:glycosyltransferase involved in cell wall biosynthesis